MALSPPRKCGRLVVALIFFTASFYNGLVANEICNVFCGAGEYLDKSQDTCICRPCPDGTYMDDRRHGMVSCKPCDLLSTYAHEIVKQECTRTSNTVIGCRLGYYYESQMCTKCTDCSYNMKGKVYEVKACGKNHDAVCCYHPNAIVKVDERGRYHCDYSPLTCDQGEYKNTEWPICLPCPEDHFMPEKGHDYTFCFKCSTTDGPNQKIERPCNTTSDTEIVCDKGFYMTKQESERNPAIVYRKCSRCATCLPQNKYVGQKCSRYRNTVCCPEPNMDVVEVDGLSTCVVKKSATMFPPPTDSHEGTQEPKTSTEFVTQPTTTDKLADTTSKGTVTYALTGPGLVFILGASIFFLYYCLPCLSGK